MPFRARRPLSPPPVYDGRTDDARDRLAAVEALFHAALAHPAAARVGWLRAQHPDDPSLVDDVLTLLEADADATGEGATFWHGGGCLSELLSDSADPDARDAADGDEASAAVPRLAPGDCVGIYRVLKAVGEGGMGAVYLAEREDVGARVALKVVRAVYARDAGAEARFLAERRALARLAHPHVARLLDAGVVAGGAADGAPWFAMEYVDGEPIDAACDRRRLGLRARLALFAEVCGAVEAAHRQLVIHRDLKPSNVLVTADGRPMLLDFGIAATLDDGPGRGAAPTLPSGLLTPQYAAPEQVRGDPPSVSVDVYALGLLLFELLTGRRPYSARGGSRAAAARAVLEARVPRPSDVARLGDDAPQRADARATTAAALRRALRGDLDAIVCRATAREPADRYATVGGLADDVRRVLAHRPVVAHAADGARGLAYRTRRLVRRHRTLALMALVVAAAGAGTTASYVRSARAAAAERDQARAGAARAVRVRGALVALFEAANPDFAGQAPARSPESLLRHGEAMADALADQPETQADLLVAIGQAWNGVGDPTAAARAFQRAVDVRRKHLAPDDPHLAEARRQLAGTLAMAHRLDSAPAPPPPRVDRPK